MPPLDLDALPDFRLSGRHLYPLALLVVVRTPSGALWDDSTRVVHVVVISVQHDMAHVRAYLLRARSGREARRDSRRVPLRSYLFILLDVKHHHCEEPDAEQQLVQMEYGELEFRLGPEYARAIPDKLVLVYFDAQEAAVVEPRLQLGEFLRVQSVRVPEYLLLVIFLFQIEGVVLLPLIEPLHQVVHSRRLHIKIIKFADDDGRCEVDDETQATLLSYIGRAYDPVDYDLIRDDVETAEPDVDGRIIHDLWVLIEEQKGLGDRFVVLAEQEIGHYDQQVAQDYVQGHDRGVVVVLRGLYTHNQETDLLSKHHKHGHQG